MVEKRGALEPKDVSINITSYFTKHFYLQSPRMLCSDMVAISTVDKISVSLIRIEWHFLAPLGLMGPCDQPMS